MSIFVLEKWHEGSKCTIYSIRQDIDDISSYTEADKFFEKYGQDVDSEIIDAANLILQFLTHEVSEVHGAKIEFFNRNEKKAQALPYKFDTNNKKIIGIDFFYKDFPLRLYCYRLSDNIIVLFNGGKKTLNTAQESPDVSLKFYEAQTYVTKIEEALREKNIKLNKSEIYSDDDEIIL